MEATDEMDPLNYVVDHVRHEAELRLENHAKLLLSCLLTEDGEMNQWLIEKAAEYNGADRLVRLVLARELISRGQSMLEELITRG